MANRKYHLPPIVPRIDSVMHALTSINNPTPFLNRNIKKFGKTYTFHMAGIRKGIMSTEPEVMQHILQKNNRNYRKSRMQTEILGRYTRQGLLTAEGAFWLRQRRLIQPAFHKSKLDGLVTIMQDEIEAFFRETWGKGGDRALYPDMHRLAFRIVARALFSTALDESEINTLSEQISAIQAFVVRRIRQPYLKQWFYIDGNMQRHDKITADIKNTLLRVLQERKASGVQANDLLDLLLSSRYEDTGEPMSEEQMLDESLILFTAGHETTAIALSWALYLLGTEHGHLEQIRSEASRCSFDSMGSVMSMQYTRQVIEETMRLYPPAWIIDRMSNGDDEVHGFSWPKDTFFILWTYGLHRDPDVWADPERFDPTRFDPELKKERTPFSYVPFGAGPRMCIGNNFAMLEMMQALAHVAVNYDIELLEKDISLKPMMTLRPKERILARVKQRTIAHQNVLH